MAQSPGHQKWPDHKVRESAVDGRVTVEVEGEVVAESRDVIRVDEDRHPVRYYFPRADVKMDRLQPSETTTTCPFKGQASYYHLKFGGQLFEDAVWSYEEPYDEHRALAGRLAFWDDRVSQIRIAQSA